MLAAIDRERRSRDEIAFVGSEKSDSTSNVGWRAKTACAYARNDLLQNVWGTARTISLSA
jgi:hypothetical protein